MRTLFGLLALFLFVAAPLFAQVQSPFRVKCGGQAYQDSKGQVWASDSGYVGGQPVASPNAITGTADPALYQTGRAFPTALKGTIQYSFNIPNGKYHVNMYFSETNTASFRPGARQFNVSLQNERVFTNLDIFAEAGANAPLIKGTDIIVNGGEFVMNLTNVVSIATIDAIEIIPGSSGPQLSLSFKYPDGTPVAGTLHYTISSSLLSFQGSVPLSNGQADCALFADPSALGISMEFTVKVSLSDSVGNQLWTLNLGMNPSSVSLGAVQSSTLAVTLQKM
jgi:hypothetical protein